MSAKPYSYFHKERLHKHQWEYSQNEQDRRCHSCSRYEHNGHPAGWFPWRSMTGVFSDEMLVQMLHKLKVIKYHNFDRIDILRGIQRRRTT